MDYDIHSTFMGEGQLRQIPNQGPIADTHVDLGSLEDVPRSAWAGLIPTQLTNMLANLMAPKPGGAGTRTFVEARTLSQKINGLTTSAICDIYGKKEN